MTVRCCPPHYFATDPKDGIDRCLVCRQSWVELARGFASNTRPKRLGKPPRSARP